MDVELNHLLDRGTVLREEQHGPWRDVHVTFGNQQVVATLAGIGMVNAAAATEHLINSYAPTAVVNSGCTGAHIFELMPGDVVIGSEVVHHAAMQILASGEERHIGFNFATVSKSISAGALPSDPVLLDLAVEASKTTALPSWPGELAWPSEEPRRPVRIVVGPVASADIWTQSIARIDALHKRHGTLCEDMEAAAIAQIAARYDLPFLTIKDISNNERLVQTALIAESIGFDPDFPLVEVGRRSAMLLAAVLERIPSRHLPA
jgi:adenosylhomocysteine nucleosidase